MGQVSRPSQWMNLHTEPIDDDAQEIQVITSIEYNAILEQDQQPEALDKCTLPPAHI